jgi:hypothetical protein
MELSALGPEATGSLRSPDAIMMVRRSSSLER